MYNRSRTEKAPVPPLLEPTPNLKGSTKLDELAEGHLEQLLSFLEKDPRPAPVSTPPKIEYWIRSGSASPESSQHAEGQEQQHVTEVKDHNRYLQEDSSDEFASHSSINQSVIRAWQAARHTLHNWGDILSRSRSPEAQPSQSPTQASQHPEAQDAKTSGPTEKQPVEAATQAVSQPPEPKPREDLLTWSYWKQLWLDETTPRYRLIALLVVCACILLAGFALATKKPSKTPTVSVKPQAALQVLADRMELLEERWHDRLQASLKTRMSRRAWRRKTRQWLRHIGRDREERRFLRKLQNKLLLHMQQSKSTGANQETWREMFTSRLGLLDLSEERVYSRLQRISRHKHRRHRTKQTRQLLQQIKKIREERKFLHFLQKKLLGIPSTQSR